MFKSKTLKLILGVFFFGSLWGFSEASFGGWLSARDIPNSSIYLTATALIILASAQVFLSFRWTGALTGMIAMLFKLINIPIFACHLLGIMLLGVGYDISSEIISRFYSGRFRLPLLGLVSTYTGRALFALTITYILRYQYWAEIGLPKVINHIFISGSIAALIGVIAVPAGNRMGVYARDFTWPKLHPRFAAISALAATLGIWIIQRAI